MQFPWNTYLCSRYGDGEALKLMAYIAPVTIFHSHDALHLNEKVVLMQAHVINITLQKLYDLSNVWLNATSDMNSHVCRLYPYLNALVSIMIRCYLILYLQLSAA